MTLRLTSWVALCALLAACTTGQTNTTPPITPGNPGGGPGPNGTLVFQMSVGTINFGGFASGLNVLETFRGSNGYTALPITQATLRGPAGFRGPAKSKDPGSGKTVIPIGSVANQFVVGTGISPPSTIFAAADGWGIGPPSCSCGGINFYPMQPQFDDVTVAGTLVPQPEPFYGGPPAYPPATLVASSLSQLVSIPSGWAEGFYLIGLHAPPPVGTYTLDATYQQNGAYGTKRTTATLHSARLLPSVFGQPVVNSDNHGGLIVDMTLPRGVKQAIVNVIDANVPPSPPQPGGLPCPTGLGFATLVFDASGKQRIPDDLGNYGAGGAPTFCKGDLLNIQVLGFDYDDVGLGPPFNSQQRPHLPVQADVTYSAEIAGE